MGFSSTGAFSSALAEALQIHASALFMLAKAYVIQEGGNIDWTQNPQKMLQLQFEPNPDAPRGPHRDPSRLFRLVSHNFVDFYAFFAAAAPDELARWEPHRLMMEAASAAEPGYAGLLPVRVTVVGASGINQMKSLPLIRSQARCTRDPVMEERLVRDAVEYFKGSINAGFPLGEGRSDETLMHPGRLVRGNGNWTWQPLFADWADYRRGMHEGLDGVMDRLQLHGRTPDRLMAYLHFWPW